MKEFIYKVLKPFDSITESKFTHRCLKEVYSSQYACDAFKYALAHRILIFEEWVSEGGKTVKRYAINP